MLTARKIALTVAVLGLCGGAGIATASMLEGGEDPGTSSGSDLGARRGTDARQQDAS